MKNQVYLVVLFAVSLFLLQIACQRDHNDIPVITDPDPTDSVDVPQPIDTNAGKLYINVEVLDWATQLPIEGATVGIGTTLYEMLNICEPITGYYPEVGKTAADGKFSWRQRPDTAGSYERLIGIKCFKAGYFSEAYDCVYLNKDLSIKFYLRPITYARFHFHAEPDTLERSYRFAYEMIACNSYNPPYYYNTFLEWSVPAGIQHDTTCFLKIDQVKWYQSTKNHIYLMKYKEPASWGGHVFGRQLVTLPPSKGDTVDVFMTVQ